MSISDNITIITNKLRDNPIFAASLGSKELFHSNILAWIIGKYGHFAHIFLPNITVSNIKCDREKHNIDLIIDAQSTHGTHQRHIAFIETKVRALATFDQLNRYNIIIEEYNNAQIRKILLSLFPSILESNLGWTEIDFRALSDGIIDHLRANSEIEDRDRTIITLYAEMCRDLHQLVQLSEVVDLECREFFWPKSGKNEVCRAFDQQIKMIRFSDTLSKVRASKLAARLDSRAKALGIPCEIGFGFDRQYAHVTATARVNLKRSNRDLNLCVYIQEDKYARMIKFGGANSGRIFSADGSRWMFSSSPSRAKNLNGLRCFQGYFGGAFSEFEMIITKQKPDNKFCSYGDQIVYQHALIGDQGISPDQVVDMVMADMKYANSLIGMDEYVDAFDMS